MSARVFIIVLDGVGIGAMPDARSYGDAGSNTLLSVSKNKFFALPNLAAMGLFNISGLAKLRPLATQTPTAAYARMAEQSKGKDTIVGHWELAGITTARPLPTYPEGFPAEVVEQLQRATGYRMLCNKPYSGTQLLSDYGEQHMQGGNLLLYTSADSVLQIAAHEDVIPVHELYRVCELARGIMAGEHGVGRIIARPFAGAAPNFYRTERRRDYSLPPPRGTLLDEARAAGFETIGIGKISDIFAGRGLTKSITTHGNPEGIAQTAIMLGQRFSGLCMVNLVDFDMLYGHRGDVQGFASALSYFDSQLPFLTGLLREDDLMIITADHGCDPGAPGTDHSREYVPMIACGRRVRAGVNLGTRDSFADVGATALEFLGLTPGFGRSFLHEIIK